MHPLLSLFSKKAIPALAKLADGIGDRQVRNRGTLGGSVAIMTRLLAIHQRYLL